jgi:hypothetical protein
MAQSGLGCRDDRDLWIERSNCWNGNGLKVDRGRVEVMSRVDCGKVSRRFDGVYLDERICILRGIESIDLQLTLYFGDKQVISSGATAHTSMSKPNTMELGEADPSSSSSLNHGKRAITARACDACRTRKLKCSGRPDTVDVSDAGVAIVPCEVTISQMSHSKLTGSIAENGNWSVATCIRGNEGEGGIWWWRNWRNNSEQGGIVMGTEGIALQEVREVHLLGPVQCNHSW